MLTDEERKEIASRVFANYAGEGALMIFAERVERAVLAKAMQNDADSAFEAYIEGLGGADSHVWHDAPVDGVYKDGFAAGRLAMPITKQEPVATIRRQGNAPMDVRFTEHTEWGTTLPHGYKLYGEPVPAQAAVIPESFVEAFDHIIELLEYVTDKPVIIPEPTNETIMRNVKKIVTKLRSLSASPKPE